MYCIIQTLLQFLPPLPHSHVQTQTDIVWWGHAVASPWCIRSSAYLESICLLPLTDLKQLAFQQLPCLCPLCTGEGGREGQREEGLGDGEMGKKKEG